jgi:hypothetical protein
VTEVTAAIGRDGLSKVRSPRPGVTRTRGTSDDKLQHASQFLPGCGPAPRRGVRSCRVLDPFLTGAACAPDRRRRALPQGARQPEDRAPRRRSHARLDAKGKPRFHLQPLAQLPRPCWETSHGCGRR